MIVLIIWFVLTLVVAGAAEARGRNAFGWFVIAFFLSPLIGILLLLVFPNLKQQRLLEAAVAQRGPPPLPKASFLGRSDRVTIDRTPRPFEPDGVFAGVPYKVADDGSIHAIMQGALVRFQDFDRFTGSLS
ncbi:hypothetical protein [Bradyrhizobium iriomotense]|uniref:Cardiolipin synthase N-terminal domain-containing protein n=1 Tax=Bradyrhizobium iriomotense TaxID=441950 RepID=A0ABQ6BAD5_9BRAD|nr:hypothetical protein [Bradyrhizobium iriomotense]GLR91329.1 hypothetical protein GCM10007857_80460 [Bradyrhizobium iriomotense]